MTKAEKSMGIVKKAMQPLPKDKATPAAMVGRSERGRFGYLVVYHIGRRNSSYRRWFATEKQRDQSFADQQKHNYSFANYEKIER